MQFKFPAIGVVFNLDELKDGYNAVKMFMKHTDPKRFSYCIIADGDIERAASEVVKSRSDYCVAVSGPDMDKEYVKGIFENMNHPGLVPRQRRILEKPILDQLGLTEMGMIDGFGRLVTDEWTRMDHDLCKEAGWGYDPQSLNYELSPLLQVELENLRKLG